MAIKNLNYDPHKLVDDDWAHDVSIQAAGSDICAFFDKKSIFITGGSGFLGKVLVEKLLRSCGDTLDTLYILCRDKKGKPIKQRLDDIYNNILFKKLEKLRPNFREKIVPISGDLVKPDFGMSKEDWNLLTEKVSIIFHVAATVRFDEKLKDAVALNIKGTRTALDLAKDCKKLQSFVYCSTAFSNCPRRHIKEEVYDALIDTESIIKIVDNTPDTILEKITPHLLGDWPNTYTYTKAIAESTVKQYSKSLPVCIFRPSMVISTYQEPIRGWIDNMYGPTGLIAGAGLGLIQTLHCDPEVNAEMIPVDLVINCMIAASYKNSIDSCEEVPVYNFVSSAQNSITWRDFENCIATYGKCVPSAQAFWIYNLTLNKYKYAHFIAVAFLHFLPAILVDATCALFGKKKQLIKAQQKIYKFSKVIAYFSTRDWTFQDDNVQNLWNGLSDTDKKNFFFNIKDTDWDHHHQLHCLGLRMYLIHDDLKTLPKGKKIWKRNMIIYKTIKFLIYIFVVWIFYKIACLTMQLLF